MYVFMVKIFQFESLVYMYIAAPRSPLGTEKVVSNEKPSRMFSCEQTSRSLPFLLARMRIRFESLRKQVDVQLRGTYPPLALPPGY